MLSWDDASKIKTVILPNSIASLANSADLSMFRVVVTIVFPLIEAYYLTNWYRIPGLPPVVKTLLTLLTTYNYLHLLGLLYRSTVGAWRLTFVVNRTKLTLSWPP